MRTSFVLGVLAVCWLSAVPTRTTVVERLTLEAVPPRSPAARTGNAFARRVATMAGPEREDAIRAELMAGNIPHFLRQLRPIRLDGQTPRGAALRATAWVMPDYLAIGSDDDFLRVPMSFYTAAAVARFYDLALPTRKLVDAVYRQSEVRVSPIPMTPGPLMVSTQYFLRHHQRIQRQAAGRPVGELISGHKKDLVLTNRLQQRPGREAIYGWHRPNGEPIQPLSTIHGAQYADYSHGVRLVHRTVLVDGTPRDIYELLADPRFATLVSDEGVIRNAQELLRESPVPAN